jgi:AcrR family transcriptional regulator
MEFKRARTEEQVMDRRKEILRACSEMYGREGFDGVTVKTIAERTSFSRPSIYNYYQTKEEILLDLLKQEYLEWSGDFLEGTRKIRKNDAEAFCRLLTKAYGKHEIVLKLFTSNLAVIENNSRDECLVDFKKAMAKITNDFDSAMAGLFPAMKEKERQQFYSMQFAFVYGLYPTTHASEKQEKAMKAAGFRKPASFESMCCEGLLFLLKGYER